MPELYEDIRGQASAVAALRAAARRPVHAYLLVGPPGSGKSAASVRFAASLLCESDPPDGGCERCRRVLSGVHPDVIVVEREGPAISIDTARAINHFASTSPVEGDRKVVILHDFHLVREAGPALLKTIEEPPASTVFVILADHVPPELETIASRCVMVEFSPLSDDELAGALKDDGIDPDRAMELAKASQGSLDRARLLAKDTEFETRREAWQNVPKRLDGTGATVATVVDELIALLESSAAPLRSRQEQELLELEERNRRAADIGGKAKRAVKATLQAGVADMETRHKRELRRQRTDELRGGLAVLAASYSALLAGTTTSTKRAAAVRAVGQIEQLGRDLLEYNPSEVLALQALLSRIDRLTV